MPVPCVTQAPNNLFFHKGWGAFVQDNSLKMADFLLFRYAGDSNFCVKIYGKDCCEKCVSGYTDLRMQTLYYLHKLYLGQ